MAVTLKFCPHCNNILQPTEDRKSQTLHFACRSCPHTEAATPEDSADAIVHQRDVRLKSKENLTITPEVIHDPTLSRTVNYDCHNCSAHEAVFWQLPEGLQEDAMALIFVCVGCGAWRQEGKKD